MHRRSIGRFGLIAAARTAAIVCLVAALPSACSRRADLKLASDGVPRIRVLLSNAQDKAEISIDGPYDVLLSGARDEPRKLTRGDDLSSRTVSCLGTDVVIEGIIRTQQTVVFVPRNAPVTVNGRRYRGSIEITVRKGKLSLVNVVDLEGYLRGVVPVEVYPEWPAAALQAQTVAARTYALAMMAERQGRYFDVYATVKDQVYGGLDKEDERTDAAIAATAGEVLTYRGRTFTTYFHAVCGGSTADARLVFADPAPPLRGSPCGYCDKAPRCKWTKKISRTQVAAKLKEKKIKAITLQGIGLDGRVTQVTIVRAAGGSRVMAGAIFRSALGLRSTRFSVKVDGANFIFDGRGWGHGVGLCQWGAREMARTGKKKAEILDRYYPGAKLVKEY